MISQGKNHTLPRGLLPCWGLEPPQPGGVEGASQWQPPWGPCCGPPGCAEGTWRISLCSAGWLWSRPAFLTTQRHIKGCSSLRLAAQQLVPRLQVEGQDWRCRAGLRLCWVDSAILWDQPRDYEDYWGEDGLWSELIAFLQNSHIQVLTLNISKCDLIWR